LVRKIKGETYVITKEYIDSRIEQLNEIIESMTRISMGCAKETDWDIAGEFYVQSKAEARAFRTGICLYRRELLDLKFR
jgi:hypothetical protein